MPNWKEYVAFILLVSGVLGLLGWTQWVAYHNIPAVYHIIHK